MSLILFLTFFAATSAVIHIDSSASSVIGNEPFFTSSFTRVSEREVDIKIMGFETSLVNGIAADKKSDDEADGK